MAKAGNFEYFLRIGYKKAYVLMENIKSSDEIEVIIWIETLSNIFFFQWGF